MIFFTRELYEGGQPKSGWERRAENEGERRLEVYFAYRAVIAPMLPPAVRKLCRKSLHDGRVRKASVKRKQLVLLVDATNSLGGFRGRHVRLTFGGLKNRPSVAGLLDQWWLYEEAHLCSRARFSIHILFDKSELEIEADELQIELLSPQRGK